MHVDDGGVADIEIAFREFTLSGDGRFLGPGELQGILRRQHLEIRLGGAQDKILARDGEFGLGLGDGGFSLGVGGKVLPAVERLGQLQRVAAAVVTRHLAGRTGFIDAVLERPGAEDHRWQQQRAALWTLFDTRVVVVTRAGPHAVVGLRLMVNIQQVVRTCRCHAQGHDRGGQDQQGWRGKALHLNNSFFTLLVSDSFGFCPDMFLRCSRACSTSE